MILMDSRNLLVLTVYFIIVTYVFYQAYKSLDNQITVEIDSEDLSNRLENNTLEEQSIGELMGITFKFKQSYKLEDFKTLPITLKNTSQDSTITVDWKQCSITDFDGVAQRVIRVVPATTEQKAAQEPSLVLPSQTIKEEVSNEALIAPLFKTEKLRKAAQNNGKFFFRLIFRISDPVVNVEQGYNLRLQFIVKKLRLKKALTLALKPKKSKK